MSRDGLSGSLHFKVPRVDLPLSIFLVGNCGLPLLFLSLDTQVTHHFRRETDEAACLKQVEATCSSCLCRGIYMAGHARLQPSIHCPCVCLGRLPCCILILCSTRLLVTSPGPLLVHFLWSGQC